MPVSHGSEDQWILRPLAGDDAPSLLSFYNGVSAATKRTFRPLGEATSLQVCQRIVGDSVQPSSARIDFVCSLQGRMLGWAFIAPLAKDHPDLGVCVTDEFQGRKLGTALLGQVLEAARLRGLSPIYLLVVKDNQRALRWYERNGFSVYGDSYDEGDQLHYFHMLRS
jgi:ribosomal protein S18 acetylase RimI-like enzyme